MKILAIRGRNLASLGEFAVDLERPPLVTAGLFAITGPTGAGKSTLLDALCLALFDRVPRLTGASSTLVGRPEQTEKQRLAGSDVRSLLRRGTSEGEAEVEFLGVDGQRYRASWQVRRARGKAGGNFQPQGMSLLALPAGTAIGRTKTEVLAAIQERLGLSFDQFRRSALLAQNEFAAFLRANPKERADLLERITGTELYGELSRRAHLRNREARQALESLQQEQHTVAPLPAEIRAARQAEFEDRQVQVKQAEASLRAAEGERDWYRLLDELQQREAAAVAELDSARSALDSAESRRGLLAAVQAAQPLRTELAARDRARQTLSEAAGALTAARSALDGADAAFSSAEQQYQAAGAAETTARQARETASGPLNEARALDSRLEAAREHQTQQQASLQTAQDQQQARQQALQAIQATARSARETLSRSADWLQQHQHLAPLAGQWPRWLAECQRLQEASELLASSDAELARADAELQTLLDRQQSLSTRLSAAGDALQQAETVRQQAEASEQDAATDDLAARRGELDSAQTALREQQDCHREALRVAEQLHQQDSQRAEQSTRLDTLHQQRSALPAELDSRRTTLAEAERALALAEAARRVEVQELRERLRPGEPCPVCGSTEHPWQHDSPLAALSDQQQQRVATLREELEALTRREAALAAEHDTLSASFASLQSARRASAEALAGLTQRWQQFAAPVALLEAADWLAAGAARLQSSAEQLAAAETAARQARDAASKARRAADKARAQRDKLQQEQTRLATEREPLERHSQTLRLRREQADKDRQASRELLAEPLAALPALLALRDDDPAALLDACQQEVEHWQQQQDQQESAARSLAELAPRLAAAERDVEHAASAISQADTALSSARVQREQLQTQRAALLDGRPVAALEAELDQALATARESLNTARDARDVARERRDQANVALATAQERQQQGERELASREQSLAAQLAELGWEEAVLRAHLQRQRDWIAAEGAALKALDDAHQQARVRLEERRARLAEHRASTPPVRDREAVEADLPVLGEALEAARQRAASVQAELLSDDRRREQSAGLLARLASLEADCRLWGSLNELIGSHDGAKFRSFAQSLTLDSLLGHANLHLQDLTHRYRLERAPGSDLELQVIDREMGDEVRGVHSLSGGESFLASLALALGLASLAADRTPVESLFIDEGFGSLDAETLDTALASLDALQAQGRQVGVISHVPALTERIGVQLRVMPRGGGRSELRVEG